MPLRADSAAPARASWKLVPVANDSCDASGNQRSATRTEVSYRSVPAMRSAAPAAVAAASDTAAWPPITVRRASGTPARYDEVAGGRPSGELSTIGARSTPAGGPATSASAKLVPDASSTFDGSDDT